MGEKAYEIRADTISRHDVEASTPINRVVCLVQVDEDLVQGCLFEERQLLVQLSLYSRRARSPPRHETVQTVM